MTNGAPVGQPAGHRLFRRARIFTFLLVAISTAAATRSANAQTYPRYQAGCYYTSCQWDQYGYRRCYWTCPDDDYYDSQSAPSSVDPAPLFIIILVALAVLIAIALCIQNSAAADAHRAADEALSEAEEAAMAQAKLDQAIRDVDDVIRRQASRAYARGRDGSGDYDD